MMNNDSSFTHIGILILLLFISVNLMILDLKVFSPNFDSRFAQIKTSPTIPTEKIETRSVRPEPDQTDMDACPINCLAAINTATQSLTARTGDSETAAKVQTQIIQAKEYFIPLGSGSTSKNSWEDRKS